MTGKQRTFAVAAALFSLLAAGTAIAGEKPHAISPGGVERFAPSSTPCPTFSWSGIAGADGYELVVYSAGEKTGSPSEQPAVQAFIPGNGLAWTPSATECLDISDSYVWSVRARTGDDFGEWSEARLFSVEPGPILKEIGAVLERALDRYLEARGLDFEPDGELAPILAQEIAASRPRRPAAATVPPGGGRARYSARPAIESGQPVPRGVFSDDVELWLEETGSAAGDYVQLVFATTEFNGTPRDTEGDAWAILVSAQDTASADDGVMLFSTPSYFDAMQLFPDASVIISELRELNMRRLSSPPASCTGSQEGLFYWDEEANTLCVCDGSSWAPLDEDKTGTCA